MGDFYNRGGGGVTATSVTSDDLEIDSGTLSIDADNNRVGMGTTAPGTQLQVESNTPYVTLKNDTSENTAGGCESKLIFEDHGNNALGQLEVSHVGSSDDEKGQLIIKTNNDSGLQTALTIDEAQQVIVGEGKLVLNATAVTSTAAELNKLDGYTGSVTELNYLDTLHATGVTNTEFDYLDGVSSAIQTQLDGKSPVAGHSSIATVGTVGTGVWQGTAVASAYLDADTAHLSTTQTFTGAKTFSADVVISGTTPQLTIGDGDAEDTFLVFDGNAADFRIGIDDGTDTLEIGKGAAHGTTPAIKVDSSVNVQLLHNSAVADGEFSGDLSLFTAGEALTAGEVCYFKSDGKMWKAVATAAATSRCVAMATASISADAMGVFLLKGFARFDSEFPTWTVGGALFTPEAETSGKNVPEQAAPDTDGDFVQVVGWAVSGDAVFFDPDSTVVEVA